MKRVRWEGNEIILTEDMENNADSLVVNHDEAFEIIGATTVMRGMQIIEALTPDMTVQVPYGIAYDDTLQQLLVNLGTIIATITTSDPVQDRRDTIEIRRLEFETTLASRQFKDSGTGVVTVTSINTETEYNIEVKVIAGSPGGNAPSVEAGWIKIAEVLVPSAATTIVNANIFNSDALVEGLSNTGWTTDIQSIHNNPSISGINTIAQNIITGAQTLSALNVSGLSTLNTLISTGQTILAKDINNLMIGTAIDSLAKATLIGNDIQLVLGNTQTNVVTKTHRIGGVHYTTAEEPMAMLLGVAGVSSNILYIGGASPLFNALTEINFYTGATTTTLTGTNRLRIDSSGNIIAGDIATSTGENLQILNTSANSVVRVESSSVSGQAKLSLRSSNALSGRTDILMKQGSSANFWSVGLDADNIYKIAMNASGNMATGVRLAILVNGHVKIGTIDDAGGVKFRVGVDHAINQDEQMAIGSTTGGNFFGAGFSYRISGAGTVSRHISTWNAGTRVDNLTLNADQSVTVNTTLLVDTIAEKTASNGVGIQEVNGATLKTKIIPIGDWDMDASSSIAVTHGIADHKKIRLVKVVVRNDADTSTDTLDKTNATGILFGGVNSLSSTQIGLIRTDGQAFDSGNYVNPPSSNRGWIIIVYEV